MENTNYYHYTSAEGLYGILDNKCIHCTHIGFLNDPNEENYADKLIEELLQKEPEIMKIYKLLYNKSFEEMVFSSYQKYIVSFSKHSNSLPMWNYYANGNGYNIGLKLETIIKNNSSEWLNITKVEMIYNKEEQVEILKKYIKSYYDIGKEVIRLQKGMEDCRINNDEYKYSELGYEETNLIDDFVTGLYKLKIRFKNQAYENEDEIRLIVEPDHRFTDFSYKTTKDGLFVEYLKLSLNLKEDITSFTIHPLKNETHRHGLKLFLQNFGIYKKDCIKLSDIPFRRL